MISGTKQMPIQDIFAYTTSLKSEIENLSVESLKEELAQNPELLLIDIREIQEVVDLALSGGDPLSEGDA